jgi:hypothetical protein
MNLDKYVIFYLYCFILLTISSIYAIYAEIPTRHLILSNTCSRVALIGLSICITNVIFDLFILCKLLLPKLNITKIGIVIVILFNCVNIWSIIAMYPLSQECIDFYEHNFSHLWRMLIIQDFVYLMIMSVMFSIMIYNKYHKNNINKFEYHEMENLI